MKKSFAISSDVEYYSEKRGNQIPKNLFGWA